MWAGVDVGGRRKGFHLATVDDRLRVAARHVATVAECLADLDAAAPRVVGVDAPSEWAPPGELSRPCERAFARSGLCGIRFTPDAATAAARTDRYLEWIEHGLELWDALAAAGHRTVEVFPTASWTAWIGARGRRSRAAWTRTGTAALTERGVAGLDRLRNQDERDAAAAALTARQWDRAPSTVDRHGSMVVPRRGAPAPGWSRVLS